MRTLASHVRQGSATAGALGAYPGCDTGGTYGAYPKTSSTSVLVLERERCHRVQGNAENNRLSGDDVMFVYLKHPHHPILLSGRVGNRSSYAERWA